MSHNQLLHLLADGRPHIGVALEELLGVDSRKLGCLAGELSAFGVPVQYYESQSGDAGYRLEFPVELLCAEQILESMNPLARHCFGLPMVVLGTTSTNQVVLDEMNRHGIRACLAEHQSAGRGRRGRHWQSPFGCNLYMSVGFEFRLDPQALAGLSLAVGVCLAEAMSRIGVSGIGLKWPNDLVTERGKLGGVLIELGGVVRGVSAVVVGLGVNLGLPRSIQGQIDQPITDLKKELGTIPSRNVCAGLFLNALAEALVEYQRHGFSVFRNRWSEFDVLFDKTVTITGPQGETNGWADGIDARGALLVRTDAGVLVVEAGDVSIRASGN